MEKDHKELEVSVHKLTRRNKELRKENGKLRKDNYILMGENEKLQDQIKDITQEYEEDGNIRKLETDYRNYLLNNMANPYLTAFNLKKAMLKDIILHGNGYANVEKNTRGKISSLEYIPASFVIPGADNFGYYYDVTSITTGVTGEIKEPRRIDEFNMLNVVVNPVANSVKGKGILDYAKETLVIANQENTYVKNLFLNGLSAKAILNSKTPFKKETKEKLRQDLLNFYSGSQNAGKMLVLEGDIAVQSLALTPADINLIHNYKRTERDKDRISELDKRDDGNIERCKDISSRLRKREQEADITE